MSDRIDKIRLNTPDGVKEYTLGEEPAPLPNIPRIWVGPPLFVDPNESGLIVNLQNQVIGIIDRGEPLTWLYKIEVMGDKFSHFKTNDHLLLSKADDISAGCISHFTKNGYWRFYAFESPFSLGHFPNEADISQLRITVSPLAKELPKPGCCHKKTNYSDLTFPPVDVYEVVYILPRGSELSISNGQIGDSMKYEYYAPTNDKTYAWINIIEADYPFNSEKGEAPNTSYLSFVKCNSAKGLFKKWPNGKELPVCAYCQIGSPEQTCDMTEIFAQTTLDSLDLEEEWYPSSLEKAFSTTRLRTLKLSGINWEKCTSLEYFAYNSSSLQSIDMGEGDCSAIKSAKYAFSGLSNLCVVKGSLSNLNCPLLNFANSSWLNKDSAERILGWLGDKQIPGSTKQIKFCPAITRPSEEALAAAVAKGWTVTF